MAFFDLGSAKQKSEVKDYYDILIIGGGPGGITAGIYAVQAGLDPLIIERALEGGQINNTEKVENWTGFPSISGMDLAEKMAEHARAFDVSFLNAEVVELEVEGEKKTVILDNGKKIQSRVLIIATGSNPRKLNVPGEAEFAGKGVSYCATCDGHFFAGKHIAVIGGGNSALDEALFLSKIVDKITIVQNLPKLTADKLLQERIKATGKVDFIFNTVVDRIEGSDKVERLILKNVETGELSTLEVEGVFVFIGLVPNTGFLKGKVKTNDWGYIMTDEHMETNVPGVYAIGDVREKEVRQIVTAAADGAIAVSHASRTYFDEE
ncbi:MULTISPECIES: thioredoxin-disulfide reductase [Kosmotoga]|uniref:Thioredoxin reductase n=1 Tax=Kosmotoga olearia (strain ATCC BAA-1733 / DSM 21960 / TBF 19.5.1) TaxID=521045 RepID=C5CD87_KOSOT|nr:MULTISPECIES: thioredoxin-disulfide reductase [Kosmotoga]ACR79031.1 FAD-dependent pyridine nucleotide-disulphide oxidoreductase [Kosmotoga olearia TBF 19.5.1]MDI3524039.1 thioredoxin reductase [Kosmotoga sp.]